MPVSFSAFHTLVRIGLTLQFVESIHCRIVHLKLNLMHKSTKSKRTRSWKCYRTTSVDKTSGHCANILHTCVCVQTNIYLCVYFCVCVLL